MAAPTATSAGASLPEDVRRRLPGRVPSELIRTVDVPRHPESMGAELLALPDISSAVADALDKSSRGAVLTSTEMSPLTVGQRIVGPAVTLHYAPLDGDVSANRDRGAGLQLGDRDLYGVARPGDVAVVGAGALSDLAVVGGLSAAWARKAGVAGVVTDGGARDGDSITATGLPVWSHGRTPHAVRYRAETVAINGPVALGNAVVRPGDYLVADGDGVCVVPHDLFPQIVRQCVLAQEAENRLLETIAAAQDLENLVAATETDAPD
ncbi:RraA family protein [Citricoccus sp.]|uniref:RraA family protein n=1 Tax=Citricoccus sp. TaxID=1978372 RepID=UPI0028BE3467|nr:RraA family protein [Citricoccus sp.]